jgi:putative ABC transport system permease protein
MSHLLRDARFGIRLLLKNPGFTSVAVLALALGIASNTAIFSIVCATLLAPMPHRDPDQLVMVWSKVRGNREQTSAPDYVDWKRENSVFQDLGAWGGRSVSLSTSERPEQVWANLTTPGFQTMVGTGFFLGRDFLPEEAELGREQVAILTHRFWKERFGGDPGLVGREIRVDGKPHTVVGILEPGVADRGDSGLSLPLAFSAEDMNRELPWLFVMGRLKPDVSVAQADANVAAIARRIAEDFPAGKKEWSTSVEPLQNNFLSREAIAAHWLLLGAVVFVLLIACANVANLLLARGSARQREVAVRSSLGAGRGRVFAQFLTESVLLAAISGALGVALAQALLDVILALMPPNTLPSEADVRLNVPVLLFTLTASLLAGVLAGCAPAWEATRSDLIESLQESGRSSLGSGRHRLRRALVTAEFALALTLLAGGGLAVRSLVKLTTMDLGFRTDHLISFALPVPPERLTGPERIRTFYRQLLERLHALPGVASASVSTGMPVRNWGFRMPFQLAGDVVSDPSARPAAGFNMVTAEYFAAFGIEVTRGRPLGAQDAASGVRVAVVNESFVKAHLQGRDPLEQRIVVEQLVPGATQPGAPVEWQIVGVTRDVRNGGPEETFPEIVVPFEQSPWPRALAAVRTQVDPDSLRSSIAAVVSSLDPDLPIADVKTMDQLIDQRRAGPRFGALLFGSFAALALVLAAVGIYGVMSFAVAQRRHEIGLRMALGARRDQVLRQVLREGMGAALAGSALGSIGAYAVGRAMQGMWWGVGVMDPVAFSAVATLLLASATLACFLPARRAASVDPMSALREE